MSRFLPRLTTALLVALFVGSGFAQDQSGGLTGTITDPTGAVIPGTVVSVRTSAGSVKSAKANAAGVYAFKGLAAGKYTVSATATGFTPFAKSNVNVSTGQVATFDISLQIQAEQQEIEVQSEGTNVDVNPENNASSIVLKEKDLEALSDDPDELQEELEALAGPAAGPNGGQIYIDGFTGGQLPPKSSIREIRINQNPFSPEYDKLGYGRIEIFTKPGTDHFHGQAFFNINDSSLNSTNPFLRQQPPAYRSEIFNGNIAGPISKNASFFFSAQRRNIDEDSVVNAIVLDQNFNPVTFTAAVANPRTRTSISPRLDLQLSATNTLTARYQFTQIGETNDSIGQFALPSQGVNTTNTEHTLQLSDTQTFGANIVNETRLQYMRIRNNQAAQNGQPEISVLSAFTDGGNPLGLSADHEDNLELQNSTQIVHGPHTIKFGGRLRVWDIRNQSTQNFNGTFTFTTLTAYQITERGLQQGLSLDQIRALGGGPSQFTLSAGQPLASFTYTDAGLYASDDFRLRKNLTLSYGLRFETQNGIHDHGNWAPRLAIAWGLGSSKRAPKTVIRAGSGLFYDRFSQSSLLNAERMNGITEQQFIVKDPDFFPAVPAVSNLTSPGTFPTVYQIDPRLRAPYTLQSAVSVERQVTKNATLTVTYLNSRGVDQFLSRNINAPLPGTYDPADPASGVRPLGDIGNVFQYQSEGVFRQNQLIVNSNVRVGTRLSLFGYYTLNYANSDTSGVSSFPSDPYNLALDYGRASFDVRHRMSLGGTVSLAHGFRVSPFIVASSGSPYNVTIGEDLNGDSIFNDRPAFAGTSAAQPRDTAIGNFDLAPVPGEAIVPINYATGPAQFTMNLRLSKTFAFGPENAGNRQRGDGPEAGGGPDGGGPDGPGGPGGLGRRGGFGGRGPGGGGRGSGAGNSTNRKYQMTISAYARNLFNHVNPQAPIGDLTSPLFGISNGLAGFGGNSAANRRIDLQVQFSF